MIKKINLLLIVISIVGSIYFVIVKDENLILSLKDLSVILTINALYIINYLFKTKINNFIIFIYILFIFIAHFLGVVVNLYSQIYWFDKFSHFLSGIVSSLGIIYLMSKYKYKNKMFLNVLFIISFSMLVASFWEIFEYTSSILFNVDPQRVIKTGVSDTMGDIVVALLGSILISICYVYKNQFFLNIYEKYTKEAK